MAGEDFYDKEGRIKDVGKAREIAELEKPAQDRELKLREETESGLTQREEDNLAIMEGLEQKYPHAFEPKIDDKGRKALVLREALLLSHANGLVLTQEGHLAINTTDWRVFENIDYVALLEFAKGEEERFEERGFRDPQGRIDWKRVDHVFKGTFSVSRVAPSVGLIDIKDDRIQRELKEAFAKGEEVAKRREEFRSVKKEEARPEAILSSL